MKVRNEDAATYNVIPEASISPAEIIDRENEVVREALRIILSRLRTFGAPLTSPALVKQYLTLRMATLEHEEFGVIWLNSCRKVIAVEDMFRGTLTQTSVYPREVVKAALAHNACACIVYHNHPSGNPEPSSADERLTSSLKDALSLVDVRVLDHIIVAGDKTCSFAERGLI